MKIAIVCYPTHGGSGVVASELAMGLAERGHEIHIVSYATPFRLRSFSQNVLIHEVEVASYPLFKYPPYALGLATKLVDINEEYKLDVIHAHYAVPHAASAFLAREILGSKRLKIITTLHGTDITLVGADTSFHRVIKFSIEQSDGVTAVSKFLKRRTIEEFEVNKEIRVIYNFVDTSQCIENSQKCAREKYAPNGEKILMHASNFRPVKRVSDVVRIFDLVRKEMPTKLLLVGEGPERLFVQQLVKEFKLSDHVWFLGHQDYIEHLLSCADLFLLPTEQESFGLVALEAHSCGVPVVGAITGGLPEVVTDGETGFLLPVGDIGAMAHKSLDLLTNDEMFAQYQRSAKQRAQKCFDRSLIIPEYEAYYREVLDR
ncbi:N-acetyl-alpha-D-glucosaminyl L-malate synthase BshA [bacterium]|nr:N-acetyl-alpha-D-glucosaminyl L-malate synthase BshA [bacterium]